MNMDKAVSAYIAERAAFEEFVGEMDDEINFELTNTREYRWAAAADRWSIWKAGRRYGAMMASDKNFDGMDCDPDIHGQ